VYLLDNIKRIIPAGASRFFFWCSSRLAHLLWANVHQCAQVARNSRCMLRTMLPMTGCASKMCSLLTVSACADQVFGFAYTTQKGSHVGYEMCQREEWNSYVTRESPRAISASEMMLYAGRAFRFGRSRTAGLTEKQRLARRDERTGLWLPPEDKVERVEAKVEYLGQHRLVA